MGELAIAHSLITVWINSAVLGLQPRGDFNNADTFRAGKPVQTCTLRHQVVIDTSTGYFTASFEMTITSASVFAVNGASYLLGRTGEVYHWNVYGKLTAQGPPAANIAGFASGSRAAMIVTD